MTKVFLDTMIDRKKGHIVTVTSTAAYYSVPCAVLYCTTKAASNNFMLTLTEQLRFDKLDEFIKTTNILPYAFETPVTKNHKFRSDPLASNDYTYMAHDF
jgi:all-trans-retinol dehydrogenase (NAD+)